MLRLLWFLLFGVDMLWLHECTHHSCDVRRLKACPSGLCMRHCAEGCYCGSGKALQRLCLEIDS